MTDHAGQIQTGQASRKQITLPEWLSRWLLNRWGTVISKSTTNTDFPSYCGQTVLESRLISAQKAAFYKSFIAGVGFRKSCDVMHRTSPKLKGTPTGAFLINSGARGRSLGRDSSFLAAGNRFSWFAKRICTGQFFLVAGSCS